MPKPAFLLRTKYKTMRALWQKREICGYLMGFGPHCRAAVPD
jgi:hypothetical protein